MTDSNRGGTIDASGLRMFGVAVFNQEALVGCMEDSELVARLG